jgi:hypothetical protein
MLNCQAAINVTSVTVMFAVKTVPSGVALVKLKSYVPSTALTTDTKVSPCADAVLEKAIMKLKVIIARAKDVFIFFKFLHLSSYFEVVGYFNLSMFKCTFATSCFLER